MKIAYFDCLSGISGDMTLGTLLDLGVPLTLLNGAVRSVLDSVQIEAEVVHRKGFRATLAKVHVPHEHVHRHLSDITAMIERSTLSEGNKERACALFRLIAEAEAKVHGIEVEKIHFHEVGAADSIADIVGAVVGLDYLGVEEIHASPVPTGCGTIQIAHGTCSIPAPATAELLRGVPIEASDVPFELTTPTGAAILKYYVKHFGSLPAMTVQSVGTGAGGRDLEQQANILRIVVGETGPVFVRPLSAPEHQHEELLESLLEHHEHEPHEHHEHEHHEHHEHAVVDTQPKTEAVWVLETNLDDLSGELIGHCVDRLWQLAPLDVWTASIHMKKQRPGITLSVLCRPEQIKAVESVIFSETTSIGIRRYAVERTVLHRESCQLETPWGPVDAKKTILPDGTVKITPEFESVKRLALSKGISVREIFDRQSK